MLSQALLKIMGTIILEADLTASSTLPSWLSLTRLSNGSRFNSSGLLVQSANDVPRFNYVYNNGVWVRDGLLVEKQKTNFIPRQYAFENMSSAQATTTVLTETLGDLQWRRIVGGRVDNDLDRVLENSGGLVANTGTDLYISAVLRKGTSGRGSLGFALADAANNTIYPKLRLGFESADELAGSGIYAATATAKKFMGANIWRYGIKIDMSTNPSNVSMRPWVGPYMQAANQYIDALVWQSEVGYPSSFIFSSSFGTITRAQDNLILNGYFNGKCTMTYVRQDTGATETLTINVNGTNTVLSNSIPVGVTMKKVSLSL